jgi:hypothetical protein
MVSPLNRTLPAISTRACPAAGIALAADVERTMVDKMLKSISQSGHPHSELPNERTMIEKAFLNLCTQIQNCRRR